MKKETILIIIFAVLSILIATVVYQYRNTPISELPLWVYWLVK